MTNLGRDYYRKLNMDLEVLARPRVYLPAVGLAAGQRAEDARLRKKARRAWRKVVRLRNGRNWKGQQVCPPQPHKVVDPLAGLHGRKKRVAMFGLLRVVK